MLLGPQKRLIECNQMAGVGQREQGWKTMSHHPPFPHTGTSLQLKYEMKPMRKPCLSVPRTLVPEAIVSNNCWKSGLAAALGEEGKRKQRWTRVSDDAPKSNGLPWTWAGHLAPRALLQGPGHCFCGIFPPVTLPAGPAVWLCLNCHPAKAAWWHAQHSNPTNTSSLEPTPKLFENTIWTKQPVNLKILQAESQWDLETRKTESKRQIYLFIYSFIL